MYCLYLTNSIQCVAWVLSIGLRGASAKPRLKIVCVFSSPADDYPDAFYRKDSSTFFVCNIKWSGLVFGLAIY